MIHRIYNNNLRPGSIYPWILSSEFAKHRCWTPTLIASAPTRPLHARHSYHHLTAKNVTKIPSTLRSLEAFHCAGRHSVTLLRIFSLVTWSNALWAELSGKNRPGYLSRDFSLLATFYSQGILFLEFKLFKKASVAKKWLMNMFLSYFLHFWCTDRSRSSLQ